MREVVLIMAEDWADLYSEDVLITQGHSIELEAALGLLAGEEGFSFKSFFIDIERVPEEIIDEIFPHPLMLRHYRRFSEIRELVEKYAD